MKVRNKVAQLPEINKALNWLDGCLYKIIQGGKEAYIEVGIFEDDRSAESNSKFHAMISDIGKTGVIKMIGKRIILSDYSTDELKALLVHWFANEMQLNGTPLPKPPHHMTCPMTGEKISIRPSTTSFSKSVASQFIEFLYATGSQANVTWSEPALKEYERYLINEKNAN